MRNTMRGQVSHSHFQDAVGLVQGVTQSKISNPVVENLIFSVGEQGEGEILATNLSVSLRVRFPVQNAEAGVIALPAKLVGQVVRELPPGDVAFSLKKDLLHLEAGRSKFNLCALSTEDFPAFMPEVSGTEIVLPAEFLKQAIEKTVFTTSEERARFQLGGIKFLLKSGKLEWVATDGRRLSLVRQELDVPAPDCSMLIPAKAAQELLRTMPNTGPVKITVGDRRVLFECEHVTLATTLLEDNFPPYQALIQSNYSIQIGMDRDELLAAVRRAQVLSNEKTRLVQLSASHDVLQVNSERREAGSATSEIDATTGDKTSIASYNASYLLDCLRVIGSGRIQWNLLRSEGAAYFTKENDDSFVHIIMPMAAREEEPGERGGSSSAEAVDEEESEE